MDAPSGNKLGEAFPIKKNGEIGVGNAGHYELNPSRGKIEVIKGMLDKTPFKPIKSFFTSILIAMEPILLLEVVIECMISWAIMMLSLASLPRIN